MKCFYCAEEIQEAARFCRHCRQDLSLILELTQDKARLQERISLLEKMLSEPTDSTDSSQQKSPPAMDFAHQSGPQDNSIPSWKNALVVFFAAAAILFTRLIDITADARTLFTGELFVTATLAVPFGLGLWLGIKDPRKRLEYYALLGILLGIILGISTTFLFVADLELGGASVG